MFKTVKAKRKFSDNHGQNICRLFHFFEQFETQLDYYQQKMNVRVASQVAEPLKTEDLRKLGNFKKITEF